MYIVPASSCPPDDKPWLLSSRQELWDDEARLKAWKTKHAANPPSSAAAQAAWVKDVAEKSFSLDEDFDTRNIHHDTAIKLAFRAVCDAAPQVVTVHVLIREKALERLATPALR